MPSSEELREKILEAFKEDKTDKLKAFLVMNKVEFESEAGLELQKIGLRYIVDLNKLSIYKDYLTCFEESTIGSLALLVCAEVGNLDFMQVISEKSLAVIPTSVLNDALFSAAENGNELIVKYLLDTKRVFTGIEKERCVGYESVAQKMVPIQCEVTPLGIAILKGHMKVISLLMEEQASLGRVLPLPELRERFTEVIAFFHKKQEFEDATQKTLLPLKGAKEERDRQEDKKKEEARSSNEQIARKRYEAKEAAAKAKAKAKAEKAEKKVTPG